MATTRSMLRLTGAGGTKYLLDCPTEANIPAVVAAVRRQTNAYPSPDAPGTAVEWGVEDRKARTFTVVKVVKAAAPPSPPPAPPAPPAPPSSPAATRGGST